MSYIGRGNPEFDGGNVSGSTGLSFLPASRVLWTLTGNTTISGFTFPPTNFATVPGYYFQLRTVSGGAYTLSFPGTVLWPGGSAGVATSSGQDVWNIYYNGTNVYVQHAAAWATA